MLWEKKKHLLNDEKPTDEMIFSIVIQLIILIIKSKVFWCIQKPSYWKGQCGDQHIYYLVEIRALYNIWGHVSQVLCLTDTLHLQQYESIKLLLWYLIWKPLSLMDL